jgi:hypothetical protein
VRRSAEGHELPGDLAEHADCPQRLAEARRSAASD